MLKFQKPALQNRLYFYSAKFYWALRDQFAAASFFFKRNAWPQDFIERLPCLFFFTIFVPQLHVLKMKNLDIASYIPS